MTFKCIHLYTRVYIIHVYEWHISSHLGLCVIYYGRLQPRKLWLIMYICICTCTHLGVLESPEDFESSEDLYEAVGGMIVEAAGEEGEEGEEVVHWICEQLFSLMQG